MIRLGIYTKVILLTFFTILCLGLALGYYLLQYQAHILRSELDERMAVLVNNLAFNSEYPVLVRYRKGIARLSKGMLLHRDIVFCRIEDQNKNLLHEEGSKVDGHSLEYTAAIVAKMRVNTVDEEMVLGVPEEKTETIGRVYVNVSLFNLHQKLQNARKLIGTLVISAIVVTSLMLYCLLKRILDLPIRHLVKATEKISHGNLSGEVSIRSQDEIGVLADAFNKMTHNLRRITVSKDYVNNIINNMSDCLIVTEQDGTIKTANQAILNLLGYTEEELIGRPFGIVYGRKNKNETDQTLPAEHTELVHLMEKGSVVNVEKNYVAKNGGEIPVLYSSSVLRDAEGRTQGIICVARDITARKQTEEKINFMAYYDALTLLPNRALFNDRLLQELAHAHRKKQKLGIMFIDLDRFKVVNDTLGHAVGDQLLKVVSTILRDCLREGDTVSRQGGDEFALIITELTDARSMQEVAGKIVRAFTRPVAVDGHDLYVGASIGVSLYPDDGSTPEILIKNADIAMYRAKENGGSRYCFYSPVMHENISKQLTIETLLRCALEKEQFDVYYQPQVNIHTGQMVGMEALIRWRRSGNVMVSTAEFIETAERTRLIAPLDSWVLSTACKQNMAWQNAGIKPMCIAVNISGHTFQNENIVKMVCAVLEETGMSPQSLELEITEGVAMGNIENTLQKLNELNALGVKIAIDDFGTGFSSLSYLTKFPIQKIKIGGTFICALTDDFTHNEIVTAIVALAKSLKLTVIAEAVETEKQLQLLKDLGCDELQGYLFSKAVAAHEMEDMLRQNKRL